MATAEEKISPSRSEPLQGLESPFLDQELFTGQGEEEWGAYLAHLGELEAESPFLGAFEQPWAQPSVGEAESAEGSGDKSSSPDKFVSSDEFEFEEPGIISGDNRIRVKDTTGVPWRWICKIDVADNRGRPAGSGTGVLISSKHVLTAAHVVYDAYKNMQQYTITVIPALNDLDEPFDRYSLASKPKIRQEYNPTAADSLDWDYALLTLSTTVGEKKFKALNDKPLCYWAHPQCGANTVFARLDPRTLNGKAAYTAGYPGGKGGKQLWCAAGMLHSANEKRRTMSITADTTKGQSGSPIWIIDNKRHCLVGIAVGAGTDSNRVVRVTRELVRQLRAWITEAGETPSMIETKEALEPPVLLLPPAQAEPLPYSEAEQYEPPAAEWSPEPAGEEAEDFTGVDYEEGERQVLEEQPLEEQFDATAVPKDVFEGDLLDETEQDRIDDESDEDDLQNSESGEAEQSIHGDEASDVDEAYAFVDEAEQWTPGKKAKATVSIASIQFAFAGNTDVHAMYLAANSHPLLPGMSLDWWARGNKITDPEWIRGRSDEDNKRAVVTRNKPVRMRVKLECPTSVDVSGTLTATPTLDGSTQYLKKASVAFTYPSGAASHTVDIALASTMPDEVGRFQLNVKWRADGVDVSFATHTTTHYLYSAYGRPLKPDYDSASSADAGVFTSVADGTLTGTRKRLDKLTRLLGSTQRLPAKTEQDLIELLWKLHVGINDTPGAPPYFDAGHSKFLTTDGLRNGPRVPIDDQWLAWLLTKSPHWNDASCIGHVQLLKTMAAAVGIFVRRTWVHPTTKTFPDKSTPAIADTDCYSLGTFDSSKTQKFKFKFSGTDFDAEPKLMEPGIAWENFEACMLTSQGRFLTGGYSTSSNPKSFTTDRGFKSAKELLRWWCNTKRPSFGKRFMAWVYFNEATNELHFWDVDGKHYDPSDYVKIRDAGKELPPP